MQTFNVHPGHVSEGAEDFFPKWSKVLNHQQCLDLYVHSQGASDLPHKQIYVNFKQGHG